MGVTRKAKGLGELLEFMGNTEGAEAARAASALWQSQQQQGNESEEEDAAALPSKRKRRDGDEELLELPALKPRSGKPRQR